MDMTSALKSEIFRPTVIFIIPGSVAAMPFIFLAVHYFPSLENFLSGNSLLAFLLSLIIAVGFGLVACELGSRVEDSVVDKINRSRDPEIDDIWYRYLRCAFATEPIGQRYIHELVLHLKFELNMGCALLITTAGSLWLNVVDTFISWCTFTFLAIGFVGAAAYLAWEATATGLVLAKVRKELIKGVGAPPIT